MADADKPSKLPWWAVTLIGSFGAFVPQLCSLIPQMVGSVLCKLVLTVAVNAFGGPSAPVSAPPVPAPIIMEECAPERRLSTGKCLP